MEIPIKNQNQHKINSYHIDKFVHHTSRVTKHSIGNVDKMDIENITRAKFIKSSSQQ